MARFWRRTTTGRPTRPKPSLITSYGLAPPNNLESAIAHQPRSRSLHRHRYRQEQPDRYRFDRDLRRAVVAVSAIKRSLKPPCGTTSRPPDVYLTSRQHSLTGESDPSSSKCDRNHIFSIFVPDSCAESPTNHGEIIILLVLNFRGRTGFDLKFEAQAACRGWFVGLVKIRTKKNKRRSPRSRSRGLIDRDVCSWTPATAGNMDSRLIVRRSDRVGR